MTVLNNIYNSVFVFFVENNYQGLRAEISHNSIFIEDVFHDSFVSIRLNIMENCLTSFSSIHNIFLKIYQENLKMYQSDRNQYILFSDTILEILNMRIYGTNNLQSH